MGRMTALHIYVTGPLRNSGAVEQGREGGVHIIFVPQGDTHKETEEHMGC
jgi:hypothetical protein